MQPFTYERATTVSGAIASVAKHPNAKFIAGGTNLLDLMKLGIERPTHLVDISRLPLNRIETQPDRGIRIGAQVTNSDLAAHPHVRAHFPLLSQALLAGASGQLRNKASVGGNLLQRTRCPYFYNTHTPCNKRVPGSGCAAIGGFNRANAILGASESCIAVHPSDMAVAMTALGVQIETITATGQTRQFAIGDLYSLPGATPQIETSLASGEMIVAVHLPTPPRGQQIYRKVRDRASYAFALVSVAAIVERRNGRLASSRIVFGGLAPRPWRADAAEQVLRNGKAEASTFDAAAERALADARTEGSAGFKRELAKRTLRQTLAVAAS
ncbi:FAD binding domain-containing protein [Tardiphaga sp.]|jgi:xanthine dehydrogenase YagS FAD-binding subunit|uniref:FAD binding domain-containing protein n=1 Tax=Tardiphaga sp. TaxID=1926292 RepID=UPI0037D9D609